MRARLRVYVSEKHQVSSEVTFQHEALLWRTLTDATLSVLVMLTIPTRLYLKCILRFVLLPSLHSKTDIVQTLPLGALDQMVASS